MPRIVSMYVIFAFFDSKMVPSRLNWILRGVFEVTFVDMTNRLAARAFATKIGACENSLKTYTS